MVTGPADQRAHGGFGFPAAGARVFGCGIALQWRGFDGGLAFFEHGVPLHGEYPSDAPAVARFPRAEREPGDACVIQSGVRCKPSPQERPMGATCFRAIARIAPMGRSCDAFRRRFPMTHSDGVPPGPDLAQGVPLADVPNGGVLAGHVDGEPVLLARPDDGFHAVAGSCTHYGGSLGEGLVVDGEVRCPLHHACFSLRTGAALRAPAFAPLATWHTQVVGDTVFVRAKRDEAPTPAPGPRVDPGAIVIVGGGAAGFAAAQRLRELGFGGRLSSAERRVGKVCVSTCSSRWSPAHKTKKSINTSYNNIPMSTLHL